MNNLNNTLIEVRNLYSVYETNTSKPKFILNDVNIDIPKGKTIGIIGESGSGKTQLISSICGIQLLSPGVIYGNVRFNINNEWVSVYNNDNNSEMDFYLNNPFKANKKVSSNIRSVKRDLIGFIPQDPKTYLNPFWTVDTLFKQSHKLNNNHKIPFDEFIEKHLLSAGIRDNKIDDIKRKRPNELSGGEAQRVMMGFVFSKSPKIIIADEPTTGVDVTTQKKIIETLTALSGNDITIILISHDLGFLDHLVDEYFVMYSGFVCEYIKKKENIYNPENLHPYTKKIVHSLDKNKLSKDSRLETTPEHQEFLQYCPYSTPGFCSQLETDIDNPKITYTEKCRTSLPDKKIDSNDDINSWKRCWYEK